MASNLSFNHRVDGLQNIIVNERDFQVSFVFDTAEKVSRLMDIFRVEEFSNLLHKFASGPNLSDAPSARVLSCVLKRNKNGGRLIFDMQDFLNKCGEIMKRIYPTNNLASPTVHTKT